jgi:solute carrier family 50 (sugar transporter)
VPYNMTLLNCLLSAWYGLPFVSPNNILVSTINGAGSAIETVYVVIFLVFASSRKTRLRTLGLASGVAAVFTTVVLVSLLALQGQGRKLFCGLAATICSICMYASPLSIMVSKRPCMPFLFWLVGSICNCFVRSCRGLWWRRRASSTCRSCCRWPCSCAARRGSPMACSDATPSSR